MKYRRTWALLYEFLMAAVQFGTLESTQRVGSKSKAVYTQREMERSTLRLEITEAIRRVEVCVSLRFLLFYWITWRHNKKRKNFFMGVGFHYWFLRRTICFYCRRRKATIVLLVNLIWNQGLFLFSPYQSTSIEIINNCAQCIITIVNGLWLNSFLYTTFHLLFNAYLLEPYTQHLPSFLTKNQHFKVLIHPSRPSYQNTTPRYYDLYATFVWALYAVRPGSQMKMRLFAVIRGIYVG